MFRCIHLLLLVLVFSYCQSPVPPVQQPSVNAPYVQVMGIAQDGGYPQVGCTKKCCAAFYSGAEKKQLVSCLGLVDPENKQAWLFDATPDFKEQYTTLTQHGVYALEGIFLTHAHIGHYTGLMQLGREVMSTNSINVYTMPRMRTFLEQNGPWSQLVQLQNISLQRLQADSTVILKNGIKVTAWLVPHRDEYSETVGYLIEGPHKKIVFLPDINKWSEWKKSLETILAQVDIAYLDATFYQDGEINRKMSEVPHPFIVETMQLLNHLSVEQKSKVHFIHFNHTNPALIHHPSNETQSARQFIQDKGFHLAEEGEVVEL